VHTADQCQLEFMVQHSLSYQSDQRHKEELKPSAARKLLGASALHEIVQA
jgi:hypothetical protein